MISFDTVTGFRIGGKKVSKQFIDEIERFEEMHEGVYTVPNLGTRAYFSLMKHAAAMVGNSSIRRAFAIMRLPRWRTATSMPALSNSKRRHKPAVSMTACTWKNRIAA